MLTFFQNVQCSVPDFLSVFLISYDKYQYNFACLSLCNLFTLSQNWISPRPSSLRRLHAGLHHHWELEGYQIFRNWPWLGLLQTLHARLHREGTRPLRPPSTLEDPIIPTLACPHLLWCQDPSTCCAQFAPSTRHGRGKTRPGHYRIPILERTCIWKKLLISLSTIGYQLPAATKATTDTIHQLLDYFPTYWKNSITYHASNMALAWRSDAGYLNKTRACSRAGSHIFLSEDDPILFIIKPL